MTNIKYKAGKTRRVNAVEAIKPKIIERPREVHIGFDKVRGIIPKTVQKDVRNTGSNLVLTASIILSLNSIPSFILTFISSKRIIQFLTTIQNKATSQTNHGKESGWLNNVNP